MFRTRRLAKLAWGLPAALLLMANVQPAFAQLVNCNAGESVQFALDTGNTFVDFTGVCNENVFIDNDDTTIRGASGNPAQDVINGSVFALGVQQLSLDSFTISSNLSIQRAVDAVLFDVVMTGGADFADNSAVLIFDSTVTGFGSFGAFGNASVFMNGSTINDLRGGVFVTNGAGLQFANTDITNTDFGVFVGRNATLNFRNGLMGPALVDDGNLSCNPLCAADSASLRLDDVIIEGTNNDPNIGGAISLSRNVSLVLRGDNVITNNGSQPAVGVFNDSSFRQDASGGGGSQINGNVQVLHMSYADFRAADITGNVEVDLHSVFRLGSPDFGGDPANTALTGDSTVSRDSAFVVEDPQVTVNGQITCRDRESSVSGSFAGVVQFNNCTNFDGRRLGKGGDDDD